MFFAITLRNDLARQEERNRLLDAHRDYLKLHENMILAAGALLGDDGKTLWGALYILEAENLETAWTWINNDPLTLAGLRHELEVTPWAMAVFDREYVLGSDMAPDFAKER